MHGVMMLQTRGIAMYNATNARSCTETAYDTRVDVQREPQEPYGKRNAMRRN